MHEPIVTGQKLFVSVIMPTYNQDSFIKKAIESVLVQTYENFELIIVDNFSEDNTEAIVSQCSKQDKRIKYYKVANHGIIAKSRNVAIQASSGDLISFLDSDDFWHPEKLSRIVTLFENEKRKSIDFICHDGIGIMIPSGGRKNLICGPHSSFADLLLKCHRIFPSAVTIRREKVFEAGLFDEREEFASAEDFEFWLRLSRVCDFVFFHEPLTTFAYHETSSSQNIDKHITNSLHVVDVHYENLPGKSLLVECLKNRRKADFVRGGGWRFLKKGDYLSARAYAVRSFKLYPYSWKTHFLLLATMLRFNKLPKNIS